MRRILILLLLLLPLAGFLQPLLGQSLYMPRNVQAAFDKGTRSLDGRPGKHYWQNSGRYNISITVAPPDRNIMGSENITYFNNSPDTLPYIVMRLVLNFHKPGAIHYGNMDPRGFTSGLHIDRFAVNGTDQPWIDPRGHDTWQPEKLPQPLLPGDSVQLSIDWHDTLTLASDREGVIDSNTYYIAYFYPRVSVFDDYNGWDRLDFTGYQEFYNDFNDYTLQVKVPRNYIVWATGTLLNPDGVLQPEYAARLKRSLSSDSVIHIISPRDLAQGQITADHAMNVWQWKADDITDMAVGISNHYDWDGGSVVVDPATGRRAAVQAAFEDTALDFHQAVRIGTYTLAWYSRHIPGVPYPYPKMTVFQGYADMEYPMMVNDGTEKNLAFSQLVENHEIGHTYFPFYMGTNESRYAFMDEGWATTLELLIGRTERPVAQADAFYKRFRVARWIHDPSQEEDLPIITPANVLRGAAYGNNAYGKPSLAYLAVRDMLGDSLFKLCLHTYMRRWHGKHPIPWDFFNSFSNASGQNLNWFWKDWFFSNHYDDLTVGKVQKLRGGYRLQINNPGGFAIPFDIRLQFRDGSSESLHQTPGVWKKDQARTSVWIRTPKTLKSLTLDNGIYMDAHPEDNTWKAP